jgi:hypothetical protein
MTFAIKTTSNSDSSNCPVDCKSGAMDEHCDGVKDGLCDPDCAIQQKADADSDCANRASTSTK